MINLTGIRRVLVAFLMLPLLAMAEQGPSAFGLADTNIPLSSPLLQAEAVQANAISKSGAVSKNQCPRDPNTGRLNSCDCDTDGDGCADCYDEFPEDAERANNYYVVPYTLAFEDRWPKEADYDLNDLVVDEFLRVVVDSNFRVKDVILIQQFVGRGGDDDFSFGMVLEGVAANNLLAANYVDLHQETRDGFNVFFSHPNDFGVQTGTRNLQAEPQNELSLIMHDSLKTWMNTGEAGECRFFNTVNDCAATDYRYNALSITFSNTVPAAGFFYRLNPFLSKPNDRGLEIHLPDYPPTPLMDREKFNQEDDDSDPGQGVYFKNNRNLPWALRLFWDFDGVLTVDDIVNRRGSFHYPVEYQDIASAYPGFLGWAESGGQGNRDWYLRQNGDSSLIFGQ